MFRILALPVAVMSFFLSPVSQPPQPTFKPTSFTSGQSLSHSTEFPEATVRQALEYVKALHDARVADDLRRLAAKMQENESQQTVQTVQNPDTPTTDNAFLACTRGHESDSAGGYGAVSPGGTYRGAYQFDQSTWNSAAASSGRPDLIGIDPATASSKDQDTLALNLYHSRGNQPWGGRC